MQFCLIIHNSDFLNKEISTYISGVRCCDYVHWSLCVNSFNYCACSSVSIWSNDERKATVKRGSSIISLLL